MTLAEAAADRAPIVIQLDLGQIVALCATIVVGLPGAASAAAGIVVAYLRRKDELQSKRDADRDDKILKLGGAIETLTATVEENRQKDRESQERLAAAAAGENRLTITNLIDLNREVVKATSEGNQQVGKVTEVVATMQTQIGGEVRRLSEAVTQLGLEIRHDAEAKADQKPPPKRGGQ
jgi:uncharacterized phage infection (PIP) family protein YhgE